MIFRFLKGEKKNDDLMLSFCDVLMFVDKKLVCYDEFIMRTTLTLDESVADGLKRLQRENPDKSFKQIVNDLIRQGLEISGVDTVSKEKFVVKPVQAAVHRPEFNFDNIGKLIETVEGDFHK